MGHRAALLDVQKSVFEQSYAVCPHFGNLVSLERHKHPQHVLVSFLHGNTFILVCNDILKRKMGQKVSDLHFFFPVAERAVFCAQHFTSWYSISDKFDALKQQNEQETILLKLELFQTCFSQRLSCVHSCGGLSFLK